MTTPNPITPPPELVQQWLCSDDFPWGPLEQASMTITTNRLQNVATQAAQWGADQELEALLVLLRVKGFDNLASDLLAARRPKPPSLKEQALKELRQLPIDPELGVCASALDTIRRALEALND
jgi:hypothetical protein